jgi:hypothetical protein
MHTTYISAAEPEGKESWRIILKLILKATGSEDVNMIHLA